jgi:hypothetical protein
VHAGRVHRFIVCASWAAADIGRALASGMRSLHVGEWLALSEAGHESRHLVVASTPHTGRRHGHGDETPQPDAAPSYNALRHAPMPTTGGEI